MNAGSNFAFLKKKAAAPRGDAPSQHAQPQAQSQRFQDDLFRILPVEENQPDTNVISVVFGSLKQAEENVQTGDPFFCKHCRSCLSSASKLYTKAEYKAKFAEVEAVQPNEQNMEERKQEVSKEDLNKLITTNITEDDKVWVCEFCSVHNLVTIDSEEVPQANDVIFLLKSAQQINKNPLDSNSDITTVFCIDNSGSMSVTQEVKGKHDLKHGLSAEEYEMLKQFIELGASQYLPNQRADATYITRKQCVLAAIEDQLLEMKKEYPSRKVGLVTFDSEVCVMGDGKDVPETVAGDKLYKYDVLRQIGDNCGKKLVTTTVKDSAESLIKKFEKLKESGRTALGPALLISLGLAMNGKQGSRVILCTDGLANVGLGEMDTPEGLAKAESFYTSVADLAKESGISISIMSIKGEGCKLDILGKVADTTSGSLTRVDPNDLTSKFSNIMKQEVIGTQVDVKLRLHQGMKFRNESAEFLKERESLYEKNVGNVTAQTELTFEYEMRPDEELVEFGIDSTKLETVPFQAQIVYTSTTGDRLMRVITNTLKTTHNLEEAEQGVNMNVLATRAIQQQAAFAQQGLYSASNQIGQGWGNYFGNRIANVNSNSQDVQVLNAYQTQNNRIQTAATNRLCKKEGVQYKSNNQAPASNSAQTGLFVGGGGYQAPSNNQAYGGSFGMNQVQANNPAPGGLFRNSKAETNNQAQGGLFGGIKSSLGSLFGNSQASSNSQAQGGLFGGVQASSNNQSFGGSFGGFNQMRASDNVSGGNQPDLMNSLASKDHPQSESLFRVNKEENKKKEEIVEEDLLADEQEDNEYEVFHEAKNYKF